MEAGGTRARTDRRVSRSRRVIVSAFQQLLRTRPLERITVSAIAQEAGVDRKTFYKHFGSISGLLDAMSEEVVEQVMREVDEAHAPTGERSWRDEVNAFFCGVSRFVEQDTTLNRRYFENMPLEQLLDHLGQPFARAVRQRGLLPADMGEPQAQTYLTYLLGGLLAVYRSWLLSDGAAPLSEIAAIACDFTQRGISGLAPES